MKTKVKTKLFHTRTHNQRERKETDVETLTFGMAVDTIGGKDHKLAESLPLEPLYKKGAMFKGV